MSPDLGRFAVFGVDDMDKVELKLLARPFGADRGERDRVVVADQDVVQLWPDRATGQRSDLAEQPHHLRRACIVTGQRARARDMPDELPRVFRTGNPVITYAAARISSSSSMTSCGVL